KNPTSSFNRRVLVGSKIRDNNFIRAYLSSRESLTRDAASSPEPLNYATAPLVEYARIGTPYRLGIPQDVGRTISHPHSRVLTTTARVGTAASAFQRHCSFLK